MLLLLYVLRPCVFWRGRLEKLESSTQRYPTHRQKLAGGFFVFSRLKQVSAEANTFVTQKKEERKSSMNEYKHPEVLVSTDWAAQHLNAPNTRFVEVDVDTTAYAQ